MLISRTLNPDDDHSLVNQPSAAKSDLNFRPKLPAQNPNQPSLGSTSTVNGGAAKRKPARSAQVNSSDNLDRHSRAIPWTKGTRRNAPYAD
jgi:hypothetical protein